MCFSWFNQSTSSTCTAINLISIHLMLSSIVRNNFLFILKVLHTHQRWNQRSTVVRMDAVDQAFTNQLLLHLLHPPPPKSTKLVVKI